VCKNLKTKSKILSAILSVSILSASLSAFVSGSLGVQAAESSPTVSANKYKLKDNIQDGVILHCFDWTYNDIKAELPKIAKAGFTSIQTSPAQPNGTGTWYWLYQPISFSIGTNGVGTKAELQSLCDEAEKYGIKIIVDVVANHLRGDHNNIDNDLKPSEYWHTFGGGIDWKNRWQVTHGSIGMPDIATENPYVQQKVCNYVQELKSVGVDGLRWDAAKHIGVPSEGDDFWKSVTQYGLYNYGEILGGPDDRSTGNEDIMKEYTDYISVTDSNYGKELRDSFNSGKAPTSSGNWSEKGISNDKLLYWGESHDTWSNNKDWGFSNEMSQNVIDRAYAVAASRNKVTALYFSRPSSTNKESIKMGEKGSTHFTSSEVAQINKFHNAMDGKADYYTVSDGCSVITRKDGGAVIVKGSGSGEVSVENGGGYAKPGTYTDAVSGNTFTITSSTISGTIGSSGIAVVYDAEPEGPSASVTPGSTNYNTDELTLTLNCKNAKNAQYSIDDGAFVNYTNGQKITIGTNLAYDTVTTVTVKASDGKTTSDPETYTYTKVDPNAVKVVAYDNSSTKWSKVNAYFWSDDNKEMTSWPGKKMTDKGNNIFDIEVPDGAKYVIFNNGDSQTDDLRIADGNKIYSNGSWQNYSTVKPTQPTTAPSTTVRPTTIATQPSTTQPTTSQPATTQPATTQPSTTQPVTEPSNRILIGDVDLNGTFTVCDSTEVQRYIVNISTLSDEALIAADVDKDSVISVKDATMIQAYIVKLIVEDSYCGTYTENVAPTQPTTNVTKPTTEPTSIQTKNYVYFNNTENWSTVNVYVWSSKGSTYMSWPGKAMESIGNNTYRFELPNGAEYAIFNNGSTQTDDLKIPDVNMIYSNGQWSKYSK
jgi:putative alpha-amylase (1,4-alpha-D-glucanglucanohydrolase)